MKHLAVIITLGFASLSPAYVASATSADAQGAAQLKAQVQAVITQKASAIKASGMTLEQSGALTVEPISGYYAVTTPEFKLKFPDGSQRVIGMLAINAIPTDKPDTYKMAIAIPTPMPHLNSEGKVIGNINIGQQSMNGLYDFGIQSFTELSATYKDVSAQENAVGTLDIPSIIIRSKLTNNGQGLLSGPTQTTLHGLQYTSLQGGKTAIKSLDIRVNTDLFDTAAATLFQAGLAQHMLASPQDVKARNQMSLSYLMRAADAFEVNVNATGLQTDMPATSGSAASPIKATSASLTMNAKALKSGDGNLSVVTSIEGIETPNMPAFMPTRIGAHYVVEHLPVLTPTQNNLFDAIKAKGSTVTLKQFHIEAPDYGLNSTSTLKFDNKTAFGMLADTQIQIRGLETAMQKLMQNTNKAQIPPFVMGILGVVQMTGVSKPDAQGRPVLHYDLKVDKDGAVTLNNAPIMQAQAKKPAAPAKAP